MERKNAITEIHQVIKVETDFHDLGMYGEYYGVILHFANGFQWSVRIQEHQFEALERNMNLPAKEESTEKIDPDLNPHLDKSNDRNIFRAMEGGTDGG